MRPKKELGQNFLQDRETIERLVDASEPKPGDVYLEIGPGQGAVTKILAPRVKEIIAVELDSDLIPDLKKLSAIINNITIIHGDVLSYLNSQFSTFNFQFNKVIGSLPYQITSPLLHSLAKLSLTSSLESATLLVQKEVAEKILAKAPDASYLSNFVQSYFDLKFVVHVSRERFYPVPKVDGTIINLKPTTYNLPPNPDDWSKFLHTAFKFPRKMIKKVFDEKMIAKAGIRPDQRPQEVELVQWQELFKIYEREKSI